MIPLASLVDRPVAVLGLGRSGLAAARALRESRVPVLAWDDDPAARERFINEGIPLIDLADFDFNNVALLVLSPGIPHTYPRPHPAVARARQAAGCRIVGDIELLAQAQPEATYVGITGTNGKSTTTALVGHIFKAAKLTCEVGGNLGFPVLEMAPLGADGIYVLELSSYQLELLPSARFRIAVLLNISPDHLDRHGGMDGYLAAKRQIFGHQGPGDTAIIGIDDEHCRAIVENLRRANQVHVIPISGRTPLVGGVFAHGGWLFDALGAGEPRPVLDIAPIKSLPGEHNAENAAAAYAAARAIGIAESTICAAIRSFPGLAHRQELIDCVNGIAYVNDSKATNAEAAARALACYRAVYWIAGGRPKGEGLAAVAPYLDRVRHAFLIGEATDAFAAELQGRVPFSRCGTLDVAVGEASAMAERERVPEAVILLSPACASFDQFRNFEARGDAFRALVEVLKR